MNPLGIGLENVTAVLLPDGWHDVEDHSFDVGPYEYGEWNESCTEFSLRYKAGEGETCPTAFWFMENGDGIHGPITSVLAVRAR